MNRRELSEKVKSVVSTLFDEKGHVAMIDVFVKLGYLSQNDIESWRMRKTPFLEKAIQINLSKISFILNAARSACRGMGLTESFTAYNSWGKGSKHRLRFSKSGAPNIEKAYSTHFIKRKPKGGEPATNKKSKPIQEKGSVK